MRHKSHYQYPAAPHFHTHLAQRIPITMQTEHWHYPHLLGVLNRSKNKTGDSFSPLGAHEPQHSASPLHHHPTPTPIYTSAAEGEIQMTEMLRPFPHTISASPLPRDHTYMIHDAFGYAHARTRAHAHAYGYFIADVRCMPGYLCLASTSASDSHGVSG